MLALFSLFEAFLLARSRRFLSTPSCLLPNQIIHLSKLDIQEVRLEEERREREEFELGESVESAVAK